MEKKIDITALGELLIDFTDAGISPSGMRLFERNAGGAPANLVCCAARLGKTCAFIGKVGRDMHGAFLKATLEENGVDTRNLLETEEAFTTLAFVALGPNGERSFAFARKPGADTQLREEDLNPALLMHTKILSVGSLSLVSEPAKGATFAAIKAAKSAGAWIAYDPNDRPALWNSREEAIAAMQSILPFTDVLKVSEEEAMLLTEQGEIESAVLALCDMGIPLVAVTRGSKGVLLCVRGVLRSVKGFHAEAVDTTGAGDAFFGALLTALLDSESTPDKISTDAAEDCARFANAAAACSVERRGAIPAMPTREAVELRLRNA